MSTTIHTAELVQVLAHLNAAVTNNRLYAPEHPQVTRNVDLAHEVLQPALASQSELTFIIVDGEVVVNNRPLSAATPHPAQFARILGQNAIERVTFTRQMTRAELAELIRDLADPEQGIVRSSLGIRLGKVQVRSTFAARRGELPPEVLEKLFHLELLGDKIWDEMREIFDQIKGARQSPQKELDQVVHRFVQGMLLNANPLDLLSALKQSDEYTYTHAINVCLLTMAQAEMLGIQGQKLYDIGIAAALHDAGKMFVPEEVLNKPGKLTDEEWVLMRHHTIRGARYILRMDGLPKLAFIGALEHHVRYDGSGYPELQSGWRPNIVSQMIAVADIFDAMRSRRPYQGPKPDSVIVKILMEERGTSFNPYLVKNFLGIVQNGETPQPGPTA
jgi:HD-GYP domain-containing protein (c-di-GMP phosphodiesterase class II)